jgi:NAD(P)H dehydrogenase (quinone)
MTTTPTILVIDGHPNPSSLTAGLADAYAEAAARTGAAVERLTLRDIDFDPVLHLGLRGSQPLEPDLARAQELLTAADHVAVFAPVWWGSVPALLKGFFDRTLEAKWAYHYDRFGLPHGHLAGRSARFIMLADSPGFYLTLVQGNPTRKQVARSTLTFSGFSPVRVTRFSPVRTASDGRRAAWIAKVGDLAAKDVGRCGRQRKARTDPFEIRRAVTADAS